MILYFHSDKVETSSRRTSISSTKMNENPSSARSSPIIPSSPPINKSMMSTVFNTSTTATTTENNIRASLRNHHQEQQQEPMTLAGTNFNKSHDPRSYLDKVPKLVKTRSGSVLSRNTILKMDHFPSGKN